MGTSASVTVTLPTSVDTSKSWIIIDYHGGQTSPQAWQIEAYFPSLGSAVTTFNLDRYGTGNGQVVKWQVVTFDNAKVQHINNVAFLAATATVSNTITAVAATNKAFAYVTGRVNNATAGNGHQGFFRANMTTTTNVNLTRAVSGTAAQATLQVIEFTDTTTVEHQSTAAFSTASTTLTLANSVSPTTAFVVTSFTASVGQLNVYPESYISAANTVTINRGTASGATTVDAYVVSLPAGTVELDHQEALTIAGTTVNVPIANVGDVTQTFTVLSFSNSGAGTTWNNCLTADELTSTSNDTLTYNTVTNSKYYALQTVSFVAPAANTGNFLLMF